MILDVILNMVYFLEYAAELTNESYKFVNDRYDCDVILFYNKRNNTITITHPKDTSKYSLGKIDETVIEIIDYNNLNMYIKIQNVIYKLLLDVQLSYGNINEAKLFCVL
jgi:uncharacterized protein YkuJ